MHAGIHLLALNRSTNRKNTAWMNKCWDTSQQQSPLQAKGYKRHFVYNAFRWVNPFIDIFWKNKLSIHSSWHKFSTKFKLLPVLNHYTAQEARHKDCICSENLMVLYECHWNNHIVIFPFSLINVKAFVKQGNVDNCLAICLFLNRLRMRFLCHLDQLSIV